MIQAIGLHQPVLQDQNRRMGGAQHNPSPRRADAQRHLSSVYSTQQNQRHGGTSPDLFVNGDALDRRPSAPHPPDRRNFAPALGYDAKKPRLHPLTVPWQPAIMEKLQTTNHTRHHPTQAACALSARQQLPSRLLIIPDGRKIASCRRKWGAPQRQIAVGAPRHKITGGKARP